MNFLIKFSIGENSIKIYIALNADLVQAVLLAETCAKVLPFGTGPWRSPLRVLRDVTLNCTARSGVGGQLANMAAARVPSLPG